jgi:hypothetical protein
MHENMYPDEVPHNMNDYGFFVDMETNMFICENQNILEAHPHSDSDLDTPEPVKRKTIDLALILVNITYIIGVSMLCYKLWAK